MSETADAWFALVRPGSGQRPWTYENLSTEEWRGFKDGEEFTRIIAHRASDMNA